MYVIDLCTCVDDNFWLVAFANAIIKMTERSFSLIGCAKLTEIVPYDYLTAKGQYFNHISIFLPIFDQEGTL